MGHLGGGSQGLNAVSASNMATQDFMRARSRELIHRILSVLSGGRDRLLPFQEVTSMLKPGAETFVGVRPVRLDRIVGSEGRYRDFTRNFLPRSRHLKSRWVRVDIAHHRDIQLPPIRVYEIGGAYFVRDGNHRVSVAKAQEREFIDAEVTSLHTEIRIDTDTSLETLRRRVIEYEKRRFFDETGLDRLRPRGKLDFTSPGRFDEVRTQIEEHRQCLKEKEAERRRPIGEEEAMLCWYDEVFFPAITIIEEERILSRFPGRTAADLFIWMSRHAEELRKRYGDPSSSKAAVRDFSRRYGLSLLQRLAHWITGPFTDRRDR